MFAQTTQTYHWSEWGSGSAFVKNRWLRKCDHPSIFRCVCEVKWHVKTHQCVVVSTLNLINSLHQQPFFVCKRWGGSTEAHITHSGRRERGGVYFPNNPLFFSSQTDDTKYSFHWSRAGGETEREQLDSNICCKAGSLIKEKTCYSVWKNVSKQVHNHAVQVSF